MQLSQPTLGTLSSRSSVSATSTECARWALVAVHAADSTAVGRVVSLQPGDSLELGRGGAAFDGALDDPRLSRKHAHLAVDAGGRLHLSDAGSSNGTYVNGALVDSALLAAGDVVRLGALVMVIEQDVDRRANAIYCGWLGGAAASVALLRSVRRAAADDAPVLIVGDPGAGKSLIARFLHDASGVPGPFVPVLCGGIPAASAHTELCGTTGRGGAGLIERAAGGTIVFDDLGVATGALQGCLLEVLERGTVRRVGAKRATRVDARFVGVCQRDDVARLDAGLRGRLSAWIIDVPPLAARRSDIPALVTAELAVLGASDRAFHYTAMARLCAHDWPGNVRELQHVVRRALAEASPGRSIRHVPLPRPRSDDGAAGPRAPAPDGALVVAGDGRWFRAPGAEPVDLGRRLNLQQILRALARHRVDCPGEPLTADDLIAAGWPGVKMIADAGINRLYVAISTLRKLGLDGLLIHDGTGYQLSADTPFSLE